MGLGGLRKSQSIQNTLTTKQNQLNSESADLGVEAAQKQAAAYDVESANLRQQGELAYFQNRQEQEITKFDAEMTAANQEHDYLSSGVFIQGSPLAVVSQTKRLSEYKLAAMEEQGLAARDLLYSKSDLSHRQGLSLIQSAENSRTLAGRANDINSQQNLLQQESQKVARKSAFTSSLTNNLVSGGLSLLKAFI